MYIQWSPVEIQTPTYTKTWSAAASVIAQQYSTATLVSLRFHSRKEKFRMVGPGFEMMSRVTRSTAPSADNDPSTRLAGKPASLNVTQLEKASQCWNCGNVKVSTTGVSNRRKYLITMASVVTCFWGIIDVQMRLSASGRLEYDGSGGYVKWHWAVVMTKDRFLSQAADPLEPRDNFYYRSLTSREEIRRGYGIWAKPDRHGTSRRRWAIAKVSCWFHIASVVDEWNDTDRGKPEFLRDKPVSVPLCPPQIPRGLAT
jgi:hypothetical protein